MKRYHLLVAAILALPVFFACGGKDDPQKPDTPDTPSTPSTPTTPTTPTEPQIEFRKTFRFGGSIVSAGNDGDFVAVMMPDLIVKSSDERKVITGSFSFDNASKTWSFTSLGKVELLENKKVAFTASGGERKLFDADITEIVSDTGSNAGKMNGSWTVKETILEFRGANYTMNGLDLNEVEKFAKDKGYEFKTHMDPDMVVTKVIITDALVGAQFKNGQSYAAEHNLRSGSEFKLSEFTNGLEGTAKIQFVDELCVLTIETNINPSDKENPSNAKVRMTLQKAK